jgi:2-dehydro-3-deoxygalactonokinase
MGLIAIDWGSSNCRAYLLEGGQVVDRQETGRGLKFLDPKTFPAEFDEVVAHWTGAADTAILFGMVTSKHGWVETPYVACPANVDQILAASVQRAHGSMTLHFLPGLCQSAPAFDVMRGEEMQLFGLPPSPDPQVVVLPGTHSKWAVLRDGAVQTFRTIITGEIFQILLDHSLAGRLATSTEFNRPVFERAVRCGFDSATPIADVFSARSSVLLGALNGDPTFPKWHAI